MKEYKFAVLSKKCILGYGIFSLCSFGELILCLDNTKFIIMSNFSLNQLYVNIMRKVFERSKVIFIINILIRFESISL